MYGLELVQRSDGQLKRGTVYVTLGRMEERGLVSSRREDRANEQGPPRRLYTMTGTGERLLQAARAAERVFGRLAALGAASFGVIIALTWPNLMFAADESRDSVDPRLLGGVIFVLISAWLARAILRSWSRTRGTWKPPASLLSLTGLPSESGGRRTMNFDAVAAGTYYGGSDERLAPELKRCGDVPSLIDLKHVKFYGGGVAVAIDGPLQNTAAARTARRRVRRASQLATRRSIPAKRVHSAPGVRLGAFARFFFSRTTCELIFEPMLADLTKEYLEALASGEAKKASWIRFRYTGAYCTAVCSRLPFSFLSLLRLLVRS